jgi:hypothetical protein
VGRLLRATRGPEKVHELGVGLHAAVPIAYPSSKPRRLGAKAGDQDLGWFFGQRVEAGVLHSVVRSVVAPLASLLQEAHEVYGLLEHLQAHVGQRPWVSEDVLVQGLAGAHAQGETSPSITLEVAAA